jgi:hypothetical protein
MMRLLFAFVLMITVPVAQSAHAREIQRSSMSSSSNETTQAVRTATRPLESEALKPGDRVFEVLDVQQLCAKNPDAAVSKFVLQRKPKIVHCDVLVAGGGLGGIAAAIRASQGGAQVCITEETDWIGGQATAQGVSALDENCMVESSGATRMYQEWRQAIRKYYRELPGRSSAAAENEALNPGDCWVSWLSFEPEIALNKLYEIIANETKANPPEIFLRNKIVATKIVRGRIVSALAVNLNSGRFTEFRAKFYIDATELGELLPLTNTPYTSGAEARSQTNEAHAPEQANPDNVQDFVYPFIIEYREGENHTIEKPAHYEEFVKAGKFSLIGYKMFESTQAPGRTCEFLPFWTYRRLIAKDLFPDSAFRYDVSMINWESNDLRGQNIIDKAPLEQARRLALAKDLSLGFLYWMQTEAPRDDGQGKGYPELFLRTDVLGTVDGLSKYPYIRESRRIVAQKVVTEEEIAASSNSGARAKRFSDSIGIGLYPIDIHGHQDVPGAGQSSKPFQIPLGALTQKTVRNLIPACKNIGTTHITNGAYRLHPIEWAIGEAAGQLAEFCLHTNTMPYKVSANTLKTRFLQNSLIKRGSPVFWYDDVPTDHDYFEAIQFVSGTGIMPAGDDHLHFEPDQSVSKEEVMTVLEKALDRKPEETTISAIKNRAQLAQVLYKATQPKRPR